eukprot:TRINITY_DN30479_c0_g2_i1.p1 TRINITY_DN30479_c0_g2~~TRINITY_DN30479_c0_g2_i1.p1  ORF type:complete len:392 (+),score=98.48 TRINITY_DN30479_c0_g2_i1:130-1176(+)
MLRSLVGSEMCIRDRLRGAATAARRLCTAIPRPITVVGSICMDNFIETDRLPVAGETLAGNPLGFTRLPGGKGANQAAGCANLGAPTWFVSRLGLDDDGTRCKAAVAGFGVDVSMVELKGDVPSGQGFVFLQPDGANSIVIIQGANLKGWDDGCGDQAATQIQSSALLMLQREIPPSINLQAAQIARENSVPVMLDVGGDPSPLPPELARLMTLVAPNETELSMLTGMPTETHDQITQAARSLQQSGVDEVLVTLGSRGSFLFDKDGVTVHHQPSFAISALTDTTGAGDCFRAGFGVGRWSLGLGAVESLEYGAAAAAILVQRKGAMTPPTREEVAGFLVAGPKLNQR